MFVNNNSKVPFNIQTGVNNNLKPMVTEKVSYAQVIILRQKDLKITEENKNKNEYEFKFQGRPETP